MTNHDKDVRISRFWEKYTSKTKSYKIKPDAVRWYVRHAEQYIKAHDKRLSLHVARDVDKYLQVKGRNICLKDWLLIELYIVML